MPRASPQPVESARRRLARLFGLALLSGGWLAGCTSPDPTSPPTLARGQTHTGQAVWQARPHAPPLAGELVLARRPGGDFFLQFSKPPLTLAEAARTGKRWRVTFPGLSREYRGRGRGTARLLWLWLPVALDGGALPPHVTFARSGESWRLANTRTGESLEGYLVP